MLATRLDLLPAGVLNGAGRFEQQQALVRDRQVDSSNSYLASDSLVVSNQIVSKKTQAESVLAPRRAVARTGVASHLGEDREHIPLESYSTRCLALGDLDA